MARKPRIHFPGALYHVISRGNQRQKIFLDEKDLEIFLSYLSEYKIRYPFRLYAYVLMANHFHLLIEVGATSLSKIMQARAVSGHLVKDVAQHFRRSPMTVSRGVIKFEERLRNDRRLRQRIEMIKGDLIKKGKRKYDITIA